jgi:hypothetical protein
MWEHYRRTFLFVQLFILSICVVMLLLGVSFPALLVPFLVMEVGGIFGARWAVRLRAMSNNKDSLPLRPR